MEEKRIDIGLSSSYITYFGNVTVKVVDKNGNQKGKTKTFKNSGRWPLFLFLTTCLNGEYKTAELLRPRYINLFHLGNEYEENPIFDDSSGSAVLSNYYNDTNKRTLITYTFNEDNVVLSNKTNVGESSITYKFLIPFTHINTKDDINGIGLYNSENFSIYSNPSAFFNVVNDQGTLGSLLKNQSTNKNYNLLIEWTLTLKNKVRD